MKPWIAIRADASRSIGSGHIMRCLALADELSSHYCIMFICRALEGHLAEYIQARGFVVKLLPSDCPLCPDGFVEDVQHTLQALGDVSDLISIIVDHYSIDSRWEVLMRPISNSIIVIDDLADRPHDADVLIDQNLSEQGERQYDGLVPPHCRKLIGPSYLLLRSSFRGERKRLSPRSGNIRRLLVFFGGSDPTGETLKVLDALTSLPDITCAIDIVAGASNQELERIQDICTARSNINLHVQVEYMARLIANADFALGAGGVTMWERCYLGLPSAVVITADNQTETVSLAEKLGAIWNLGWHTQIKSEHYADILHKAWISPDALKSLGVCSLRITGSTAEASVTSVKMAILEELNGGRRD